MKELIKQNGVLKVLMFLLAMTAPLSLVVGYGFVIIKGYLNGWLNISAVFSFLVLCWIFFGVTSNDFFGEGRCTELRNKHFLMMSAWPLALILGVPDEAKRFYLFISLVAWSVFFVGELKRRGKNKSFYWKYEIVGESISSEMAVEAVKKEFFLVKIEKKEQSMLIKGIGLSIVKLTMDIQGMNTRIWVEPMSSGITFLLFLKVLPIPLGEYYGKKILKNLGQSEIASTKV